jgi:hypothetical protein
MITSITPKPVNDFKFADMLLDYVNNKNPIALAKIKGVLQAFVTRPQKEQAKQIQAMKIKLQAFGVSTDFTQLPRGFFDLTIESTAFDMAWQLAFKEVQKDTNQSSWTIYNAYNGITFHKVPEGDRIQVDGISGNHVTVEVDYYGGALGFTDKMIRYRQVAAMVNQAEAFRNKLYSNKADNHYALLATAAALNITAYQGVAADGELQRDIKTINQAAFTLTNRNKDKGYGDMAQVNLLMYANPRDKGRLLPALNATTAMIAAAGRSGEVINYTITPQWTYNSNIVTQFPILVIPGNQIQRAEDMAPTTYTAAKDVLTLNETIAVWTIYGAAVGDSDQCQTITLG